MTPNRSFVAALCVSSLLALALPAAEAAQPGARRLQLNVELQRTAGVQGSGDSGRSQLSQQVTFSAVLHTDGVLAVNNPLDPEDGQRQLQRAQRTQQRVQQAMQRHGGGMAATPSMADVQAMQARAAQLQAKCGTDRDCLMREAMAMSSAQVAGGDRNVQARLQSYGQAAMACERATAAGAAREACLANARRQAGGSGDEGPADDAVEAPYLHFVGRAQCQLDASIKLDERVEGRFQDVQGAVGYAEARQADQRLREPHLCPLLQAVLDTRDGRLWTHALLAMPDPKGVSVRTEKGRAPQRHDGEIKLRWYEAEAWLLQRLHKLDTRGGEDRARLPAGASGKGDGQTEMRLRWSFEPV